MSIKLVENEIRRFLASREPEVICISGHWGVGKTFAWNRYLQEAKKQEVIALSRYAYVSLFGINSLEELKYAIFENTVQSSQIGIKPSLETLRSNTKAVTEGIGRRAIPLLSQIPFLRNYVGWAVPAIFLSISKMIVCLDDLERAGKGLEIRDVLGLASNLKEQKSCKVCLILNDEALEESKQQFHTYFEKVIDTSLKFEPSAQECVDIAVSSDTEVLRMLGENCVTLGISNIRLIVKLEQCIRRVLPLLRPFDKEVTRQAIQSIVLLGWSVYEPGRAPSLDYLRARSNPGLLDAKKTPVPPQQMAWNSLMSVYHFTGMDDFDVALLDGVQKGFFDPELVEKCGAELDRRARAMASNDSFVSAWNLFHDSFADNQEQVLDKIYAAFRNSVHAISPLNMNSTVALFKELERVSQAKEMIRYYVDSRDEDAQVFDLSTYSFQGEITDPDVIAAFNSKFASLVVKPDIQGVLLSMAKMNGWNPKDIRLLSAASVEDLYAIFKQAEGDELRKIINSCLQFNNILNATAEMKRISDVAAEALQLIGMESAINARRVRAYGITVDLPPSASKAQAETGQ